MSEDIHIPLNHEVETYTGRFVNVAAPEPSTIDIRDVAHALANTCRYGGHCSTYYSVAEHAVLCAWYSSRKNPDPLIALAALHHDDAEAYLGDIPRPIKGLLGPAYADLTEKMDLAIMQGLNLPVTSAHEMHKDAVREADNWALLVEANVLLPSQGKGWGGQECNWDLTLERGPVTPPDDFAFGLRPNAAEGLYLQWHRDLLGEIELDTYRAA